MQKQAGVREHVQSTHCLVPTVETHSRYNPSLGKASSEASMGTVLTQKGTLQHNPFGNLAAPTASDTSWLL